MLHRLHQARGTIRALSESAPGASETQGDTSGFAGVPPQGEIRFAQASFAYPGQGTNQIEALSGEQVIALTTSQAAALTAAHDIDRITGETSSPISSPISGPITGDTAAR